MIPFLRQFQLVITPLTPIHIGCDTDFEPTNYLIDEQVLYGFDPSQAVLPDNLRQQLQNLGTRADILGIQKFFQANARLFKPYAKILIPVASGIEKKFNASLGKVVQSEANGNRVINELSIQRCSFNPHTGLPFIPGSSVKGAVRTALLDALNQNQIPASGEKSNVIEKRLFKGDFETSPLRLLKIADFMPVGELAHQIQFAVNRKKRLVFDSNKVSKEGLATRKETITPGQYRSLFANVTLHHVDGVNSKNIPSLRYDDLREIAKLCNRYYLARLNMDLTIIDQRRFATPAWLNAFRQLLENGLREKLDSGEAFLINLGRYGGAECKTFRGEGVSKIKILRGGGLMSEYSSTTKTLWLASDAEDAPSDMQPFGWAFVEIDPAEDLSQLRAWCEQQTNANQIDMQKIRAAFEAEKYTAAQDKRRLQLERTERQNREAAERQAEQEREKQLAAMNPAQRLTEELCNTLHNAVKVKQPGSPVAKETLHVIELALDDSTAPSWSANERKHLAERITPLLKEKMMLVGKDEKTFKSALRKLRGES